MYNNLAEELIKEISHLLENENAKENFINYLSYHFPEWIKKYASTPEDMIMEIKEFAHMFD